MPDENKGKLPTIADYWDGRAYFHNYYNETPGGSAGLDIVVANGAWYRFDRFQTGNDPATGVHLLGTQVRKSTDKGMSWSAPAIVAAPEVKGTAWYICATDSSAYYDGNKWRILFQSMEEADDRKNVRWDLSYLECDGPDPMNGKWHTPDGIVNPVTHNGDIWNQIAVGDNDCTRITGGQKLVYDEGTPKIIVEDGIIYVTFHGASNTNNTIYGYRGIATTADFKTFTKAADDAIFDCYDAKDWNVDWVETGSVGGGHAVYLKEGEYWYTMIESPDVSLACVPDQHWTFGMLRSKSLTDTKWENWKDNPVPEFAPTGAYVAEWVYTALWKDEGVTYLAATHTVTNTYKQYRLEWK